MPIRPRALVQLALSIGGCDVPGSIRAPMARGGVMDLSHWDFRTQGPVSLGGERMFRCAELLGPSILNADQEPSAPLIAVPRPWNGVVSGGAPLQGEGFATQALRLILPPNNHDLGRPSARPTPTPEKIRASSDYRQEARKQ